MKLISDDILEDREQRAPTYLAAYPAYNGFDLTIPKNWTGGQPWEAYKWMRENAPVCWQDIGPGHAGFWAVTRYEDIKFAETHPEIYSSQRGSINMALPPKWARIPKPLTPAALNSLINFDAPQHMELRIQHKDFFIPDYVKSLKAKVAAHIDGLLDKMEAAGPEVDLVKMFSEQIPLYTLCEMLGIDEEDRPRVITWMHYLERAQIVASEPIKTLLLNPLFIRRYVKNVREMFDYGKQVMADRRANPREDMLTMIAHAELGGERLPQEYLDGSWLLIIFAGNDTSRNSISGTMRLLRQFPEQKRLILDDPSLIPSMINEALRMVSPVIHMRRTAMQDTELGGQKIARDEKVIFYYGAANRDPDVFPDPDRFDTLRPNADKHLAFGHGPHKCLGQRIAKMQMELAFTKLLERFPNIEWTGEQTIAPNNFVHAISSLKVNLGR